MAAKKATSKRRSPTVEAESHYEGSSNPRSRRELSDFSEMGSVRQWLSNPAVRYVAGGIATAVLAKLASNISGKYPSISTFIREGMDAVEGKLAEFNEISGDNSGAPRARRASAGLNTH